MNIYIFQQPFTERWTVNSPATENLGSKLGSRILQAHNNSVYEIDLNNNNLLFVAWRQPSNLIFFGMITRVSLNRLHENGNISLEEFNEVYNTVHHYFIDLFKYIEELFPISHDAISNWSHAAFWSFVWKCSILSWQIFRT